MQYLLLNNKKFYYDEIAAYSFRNSIEINGYEAKTLEFCKNWLAGQQEFSIHTSGSTGTPKLITLTRQQLETSAKRTIILLGLKKGDRALINLNTEFIGGMMMLVRGFIQNLQMTIIEPVANPLINFSPEEAFEFQSYVPLQIQNIIEQNPEKIQILNTARAILIGGAPVNYFLDQQLQIVQAPVYHTYGMTETVSHIALRRINGSEKQDFYQAPEDIHLSLDKRGCLTIQAEVTNNEIISTNDLVEFITPQQFKWLGRIDNTINSGGVKIQLEKVEHELEQALCNLNIHRRHFVSSLPDEKLGEKLIAILEGAPLSETDENNLRNILEAKLGKYQIPKLFGYLPEFHETASGKIDKQNSKKSVF